MRRAPAFFVAAFLLFLFPVVGQQGLAAVGQTEKRGMVPEDYYRFQFVSDPQISPDGTQIAFVVATVSKDRRSRESSIYMVAADGSAEPRKFTGGTSDRSPRWSSVSWPCATSGKPVPKASVPDVRPSTQVPVAQSRSVSRTRVRLAWRWIIPPPTTAGCGASQRWRRGRCCVA